MVAVWCLVVVAAVGAAAVDLATPEANKEQEKALRHVFESCGGTEWRRPFELQGNACLWRGVGCNDDGDVVWLSLENNNLHCTFPHQLFALPHLQFLALQGNDIEGTIPLSISSLSSLQRLHGGGNKLAGPLPSTLSTLGSLVELDLSNAAWYGRSRVNRFTEELPDGLFHDHSVLEELYLNEVGFHGTFPEAIFSLKQLKRLSLAGNALTGTLPSQGWSALANLEFLDISRNEFQGGLPAAMVDAPLLRFLYVQGNKLEGVPEALDDHRSSSLAVLACQGNALKDQRRCLEG